MSQPEPPRILIIDDEPPIHRFLGPALESAGYAPLHAQTASEGLRLASSEAPAVILLDLGLPDLDGQVAIPCLRSISKAPIVVLSARGREEEKVKALDNGAEDYVEKPFALGELLARLRVALRRSAASATGLSSRIRIGPLEIDLDQRTARLDGQAELLRLSPREWDLLAVFARAAGRVLTHQQLLSTVWGTAHLKDAQYLRVYVQHLRQKLGPAGRLLQTEPGIGYRFDGAD
jgi:two-component system KDP operon response regulator KdpE